MMDRFARISDIKEQGKYDSNSLKFNYITPVQNTPIIRCSSSGWDQDLRELGNVKWDGTRFITFYTGYTAPYTENNVYIGVATSLDGVNWVKGGPNGDGKILERSSEDPFMIIHNGTYYLYVEDKEDVPARGIWLYTSKDLLNWTTVGMVLDRGDDVNYDSLDVSSPTILVENGTWHLLYEVRSRTQHGAISYASSLDGINWIRHGSSPVLAGTLSNGDIKWAGNVVPDDILKLNGVYYLTFHGTNSAGKFINGMAISTDLLHWVDYIGTWISKRDQNLEDVMIHHNGNQYMATYLDSERKNVMLGVFANKSDYDLGAKPIKTTADIEGKQFVSNAPAGVPPAKVSSNTVVQNLNADLLDGKHGSDFFLNERLNEIIKNQIASAQDANFWISGDGKVGKRFSVGGNIATGSSIAARSEYKDGITIGFISNGKISEQSAKSVRWSQAEIGSLDGAYNSTLLMGYNVIQTTLGAEHTIDLIVGYNVDASLIRGSKNIAYRGQVPAGIGRYNLYMDGFAQNYLGGSLGIGIEVPAEKLHVVGNIQTTGLIKLGQYTTATRPAYIKGAKFFDTTLNKEVVGGATGWEVTTSVLG